MRTADDAPGDRGAGVTHLFLASAFDDVVRYQVEGEAQPRIVIDARTNAIYVGNGVVYPTTPLGGGGGVPISLTDEGGLVEASLLSLDLVGAGAIATSTGPGAVKLTVAGTDRGLLAARPAASAAVAHELYVATDVALIYYCDGAAWFLVSIDHGAGLTGLGDDDHTQYHNDARGDARYEKLSALTEDVQDIVGAMVLPTSGIVNATYNDPAGTLTLAIDTAILDERTMDTIAAMLVAGTNITLTYNDALNTLTIDAAGGGASLAVIAKNANYTAVNGDLVICDASGGAFNITAPASGANKIFAVKKRASDTSANAVNILRAGADVFENALTAIAITTPGETLYFQSDGSGVWHLI